MTTESDSGLPPATTPMLESAIGQLREDCRLHEKAVQSYNTHLENHRERRDLHNVPARTPATEYDAYEAMLTADREAMAELRTQLIDQAHLDSAVRTHPRTYPVHLEALEHLELARDQLIGTLEEAIQHTDEHGA